MKCDQFMISACAKGYQTYFFVMEKIKISALKRSLFQCPWNESRVWRNRYFRLFWMALLWFLLFLFLNTVLIMVILPLLLLSCDIFLNFLLYKNFLDSLFFDLVQNLWLEERLFNRCFFLLNILLLFLFLIFLFHQVNIIITQQHIAILLLNIVLFLLSLLLSSFHHLLFGFFLSQKLDNLLLSQTLHVARKF